MISGAGCGAEFCPRPPFVAACVGRGKISLSLAALALFGNTPHRRLRTLTPLADARRGFARRARLVAARQRDAEALCGGRRYGLGTSQRAPPPMSGSAPTAAPAPVPHRLWRDAKLAVGGGLRRARGVGQKRRPFASGRRRRVLHAAGLWHAARPCGRPARRPRHGSPVPPQRAVFRIARSLSAMRPARPDALRARGLAPISQRGFFGDGPTLNDDHHPKCSCGVRAYRRRAGVRAGRHRL